MCVKLGYLFDGCGLKPGYSFNWSKDNFILIFDGLHFAAHSYFAS